MKGMFKRSPFFYLFIFAFVVLHGYVTDLYISRYGQLTVSGTLKFAGIVIAGVGLLFGVWYTVWELVDRVRMRSKVRQKLFDDLAMQVEIARHPPIKELTTEIESKATQSNPAAG